MAAERKMLDAAEAGELLGLHEETVRRFAREGKIPAFKVGGRWRFHEDTITGWAQGQSEQAVEGHALIVDDDPVVRELVQRMLRSEDIAAVTAASGGEAIRSFEAAIPSVMLLDLKLPDMSARSVMERVRELYPDLPVIIITGYPDSHLIQDILAYGPVTVLPKPLTIEKIAGAVRMVTGGAVGSRNGPQYMGVASQR